ncbi:MAG: hypothetical protein ACYSU0_21270, partial [Planctomycetota bacterium]
MPEHDGRHRRPSDEWDNLERDQRTGIYYWRKRIPGTKKRKRRSTGFRHRRKAQQRAKELEAELQQELAGLLIKIDYSRKLAEFVEPFLASLSCGDERKSALRMFLHRAFGLLRLERLADLADHTRIEPRMLGLEK